MLEEVIYNLIDNSIRHGEKVTEIRSFWYKMNEDVIWVVEDNGVDVPVDIKGRIFNKGFGENTGISIRESDIEGKGASFEIQIPKIYALIS